MVINRTGVAYRLKSTCFNVFVTLASVLSPVKISLHCRQTKKHKQFQHPTSEMCGRRPVRTSLFCFCLAATSCTVTKLCEVIRDHSVQ